MIPLTASVRHSTLPADPNWYTDWYMLTATKIKNIKTVGDHADINGLYLRVSKTGVKSWLYRFTFDSTRSAMSLGKVATLSLADARAKVVQLSQMIADGLHPNKPQTESRSFQSIATTYINMRRREWKNVKHGQQWVNTLEAYAFPYIGGLEIRAITTKHIRDMLSPIWNDKPETATRVRSRVENIIDYAIALDESDKANPAALKVVSKVLPKQDRTVKHFSALPYTELPEFYASLADHMSHYALRMLILTACRTTEVRCAEWSEIEGDLWIIPKERMKSDKEHRVPLTPPLVEMLAGMVRLNKYIFPSPSYAAKPLSNIAMLKTTKIMNPDITVHGFRSSFKDWCTDNGHDERLSESALAHVIADKTVAAYERTDLLERRRNLMSEWAEHVLSLEK